MSSSGSDSSFGFRIESFCLGSKKLHYDDAKLNFEISSKNKKIQIPLPRNHDRSSLDFPLNFVKGIQIFHCTNSNYSGVDTFYTYLVIQTYVKDQEGTFGES